MKKQDKLIIGKEYYTYLDGRYTGVATFVYDENIGEAFISQSIDENGELINHVYMPDSWEVKN